MLGKEAEAASSCLESGNGSTGHACSTLFKLEPPTACCTTSTHHHLPHPRTSRAPPHAHPFPRITTATPPTICSTMPLLCVYIASPTLSSWSALTCPCCESQASTLRDGRQGWHASSRAFRGNQPPFCPEGRQAGVARVKQGIWGNQPPFCRRTLNLCFEII